MLYLVLKVVHIIAVMTWIAGMMIIAVVMSSLKTSNSPLQAPEHRLLHFLSMWDRRVTTPAMLTAWTLGLAMASTGHWFGQGWLQLKLALVFF